jgi:hypothetical protein
MAAVAYKWQNDAAKWQQLITNGTICVPTLQEVHSHGSNCLQMATLVCKWQRSSS